jgi:uncharacterized protein (TIRG00374 family)
MSSSPKSSPPRWYLPFAVLVSVVFLYFAIRGVKWDEFAAHVAQCRLEFLIPGLALGLVNYVFRSQRWGVLVKARQPVSARTLFWSAGVGYLGNNYLPFRSDEVIRTVALAKKTGIGMAYVFATALTERVLDAIFLILLALFLIPTISQAPDWLTSAMWGFGLVGLAALIFLFLAPLLERQIHTIFHRLPLPARWRPAVILRLEQFLQGAASFHKPARAATFLLMTCIICLLDGAGVFHGSYARSILAAANRAGVIQRCPFGAGLRRRVPVRRRHRAGFVWLLAEPGAGI